MLRPFVLIKLIIVGMYFFLTVVISSCEFGQDGNHSFVLEDSSKECIDNSNVLRTNILLDTVINGRKIQLTRDSIGNLAYILFSKEQFLVKKMKSLAPSMGVSVKFYDLNNNGDFELILTYTDNRQEDEIFIIPKKGELIQVKSKVQLSQIEQIKIEDKTMNVSFLSNTGCAGGNWSSMLFVIKEDSLRVLYSLYAYECNEVNVVEIFQKDKQINTFKPVQLHEHMRDFESMWTYVLSFSGSPRTN